jgi:hypothetical protein
MLSFVFLTVSMHPLVEIIWRHFFRHCPAGTEAIILNKQPVLLNWNVATKYAKFDYPDYNLRFTHDMVDLMHAGAMAAQPRSTVAFLSDTSVPLKSCASIVSELDNQTFVRLKTTFGCTKGSQWMSMPKRVWMRAYANVTANFYKNGRCALFGAPDETLVQAQLYGLNSRKDWNTHAIFWDALNPFDGHPRALTEVHLQQAILSNYSFARKFDPELAIYNFDWLLR